MDPLIKYGTSLYPWGDSTYYKHVSPFVPNDPILTSKKSDSKNFYTERTKEGLVRLVSKPKKNDLLGIAIKLKDNSYFRELQKLEDYDVEFHMIATSSIDSGSRKVKTRDLETLLKNHNKHNKKYNYEALGLTDDWLLEATKLNQFSHGVVAKEEIPQFAKHIYAKILQKIPQVATSLSKRMEQQREKAKDESQKVKKEVMKRRSIIKKKSQFLLKSIIKSMNEYHRGTDDNDEIVSRRRQKQLQKQELESQRNQKKLDFLLSQTEIYSHFIKHGKGDLTLTADKKEKVKAFDLNSDVTGETMLENATTSALMVLEKTQAPSNRPQVEFESHDQPDLLQGTLKPYQLDGFNWLVSLFESGINGILADDMGLGKTIQTIAFLLYLAEKRHMWGTFLIIAPNSTLHNWVEEINRFAPQLKVLPYWSNHNERKVLLKSIDHDSLGKRDGDFHVCVTNYSIARTDTAELSRLDFDIMILDEAQVIKSKTSQVFNNLLRFPCKNRFLLTGTPIQNNMTELWALLHFIMPGLFDNLKDFSDWFDKDFKTMKSTDVSVMRLQQVLKPFMLRRTKSEVENQLGEKIEYLIKCQMTQKQQLMYDEELEFAKKQASVGTALDMVIRLRQICNHIATVNPIETMSPFAFANEVSPDAVCLDPIANGRRKTKVGFEVTAMPQSLFDLDIPICIAQMVYDTTVSHDRMRLMMHSHRDKLLSALRINMNDIVSMIESFVLQYNQWSLAADALEVCPEVFNYAPIMNFVSGFMLLAPLIKNFASSRLTNIARLESVMKTMEPYYTVCQKVISPPMRMHCVDWFLNMFLRQQTRASELSNTDNDFYGVRLAQIDPFSARIPPQLATPDVSSFLNGSGKLVALRRILIECQKRGDRCLVYCQYHAIVDILEQFLVAMNMRFVRFDGSTKVDERRDLVDRFYADDSILCFLLTTRAGGVGINLVAANVVIFFESDWNPTWDSQAMDRAHRLGQTKQVSVFRLVTKKTIEERIVKRAQLKHKIQRMVMEGQETTGKENVFKNDELLNILHEDEDEDKIDRELSADSVDEKLLEEARNQAPTPFTDAVDYVKKLKNSLAIPSI
ncbi:hypothetical protein PCE1_000315 [Barthelona sp. PCE]